MKEKVKEKVGKRVENPAVGVGRGNEIVRDDIVTLKHCVCLICCMKRRGREESESQVIA